MNRTQSEHNAAAVCRLGEKIWNEPSNFSDSPAPALVCNHSLISFIALVFWLGEKKKKKKINMATGTEHGPELPKNTKSRFQKRPRLIHSTSVIVSTKKLCKSWTTWSAKHKTWTQEHRGGNGLTCVACRRASVQGHAAVVKGVFSPEVSGQ